MKEADTCGHAGPSPSSVPGTALTHAGQLNLAQVLGFGRSEGSMGIIAWLKAISTSRRAGQGQEKSLVGDSIEPGWRRAGAVA